MTRWFSRFSAVVAVLIASGWVATTQADFTPRVIYTLGEGFDLAQNDGDPVFGASDSAVWPEGADEDYSADMVFNFPTWSTDTRGPQSDFSLSIANVDEGVGAPFVAWWNNWPGASRFRIGVQAWVKPDPNSAGSGLVTPVLEDLVGIYIDEEDRWRYARNGDIHEGNRGNTWDFVDGTGDIAKVRFGEWQHVAARTDGSSWDIYVDGTKVSTTNSNNWTYGGSGPNRAIGLDRTGVGGYTGLVDDFQSFWYDSYADFATDTQYAQELVLGDATLDGIVNQLDYDVWRMNVNADTSGLTGGGRIALGDVDLSGLVDLDDFGIIKGNLSPGFALSIPEPSTCIILLVGLVSAAAVRRRSRTALKHVAIVAVACVMLQPADLFAQAVWGGGDGNWTDANWTGGTGTGGRPRAGDAIVLPNTTGTLTVTGDSGLVYDSLRQAGGVLTIEPAGKLEFSGMIQTGRNPDAAAGSVLNLAGELLVGGGFDIGFDVTPATVSITDSAVLRVGANMDTWWADGAALDVTGGNADVEVGGTFYIGTGAAMNVNIDSSSFSTFFVPGTANFPGGNGTLNVSFVDGFTPAVGTSWVLFDAATRSGTIPIVNVPDFGFGTQLGVNYSQGGTLGELVTLDFENTLNLKVLSDGSAVIENPAAGAADLDVDGYLIRSESDSLNATGFTGLGEAGWLPAVSPSQNDGVLSETNLNSSTTFTGAAAYDIGQIFNTTEGVQDLVFELHLAGGGTIPGTVQYLEFLPGDFDKNGAVDGNDFLAWQANFLTESGATQAQGDADGNGTVDGNDFLLWQANFGSGSGGGAGGGAIPEPTAGLLLVLATGCVVARRGR